MASQEQILKLKKDFNKFAEKAFLFKPVYFGSLVIRNCNGMGPCPFRDATIFCEKAMHCFPVFLWWKNVFQCIGKELAQINRPDTLKGNETIEKLINAFTSMSCKHEKCMKQLLEDDSLSEEKIKCILAIHYFKPLSNDADYCVDRSHGFKDCPGCKEKINVDHKETSFGNSAVWYGQADILVHRSIVKIDTEAALSLEDHDDELLDNESFCSEILEVNTKETKKSVKSFYQAIAQTIVNAFVVIGEDKSLFNKFIPSFFATEKIVRIMLYNCELDKLLVSDEFKIWQSDGSLNLETMMFVWVALTTFVNDSNDTVKHLNAKTAVSEFKDVVGEAYTIYLNDVTRPYKKVNEEFTYIKTFNKPFDETVDDNDISYIVKAGVELFQHVQVACSEGIPAESEPKHFKSEQS